MDAYAGFVLRRALLFAAKFEDVAPEKKKKKGEEAECPDPAAVDPAVLKRAQNVLLVVEHGLSFVDVALADSDPRRAHLVVVPWNRPAALVVVVRQARCEC